MGISSRISARRPVASTAWRSLLLALVLVGACLAPLVTVGAKRDDAIDPRIVGGTVVPAHTYEFIAFITVETKKGSWLCGGTLIDATTVLTAGHCVTDDWGRKVGPKAVTVTLARNDRKARRQGTTRKVSAVERHPDFTYAEGIPFDLAALTLRTPVVGIAPINMPAAGEDDPGQAAIVAGWGATREGGGAKNLMRQTTLSVIDTTDCSQELGGRSNLGSEHLCAFAQDKDSCQGDSGGPLFIDRGADKPEAKRYAQIGIVSWGIGCGRKYPGVYTRLSDPFVAEFIAKHLAS